MAQDPVRDTYAMAVSDDPLDGDHVRALRFGVALRGYAMDQVDAVLDRLATELDARDARVAELTARVAALEAGRRSGDDVDGRAAPGLPTSVWEQPR